MQSPFLLDPGHRRSSEHRHQPYPDLPPEPPSPLRRRLIKPAHRGFLIRWMIATAVSGILSGAVVGLMLIIFLIPNTIPVTFKLGALVIASTIAAAVFGFTQRWALKQLIPDLSAWTRATVIGAATIVGLFAYLSDAYVPLGLGNQSAIASYIWIILPTVVATTQWIVLRRYLVWSWLWIPLTLGALLSAAKAMAAFDRLADRQSLLQIIAVTILYAGITGQGLLLLHSAPRRPQPVTSPLSRLGIYGQIALVCVAILAIAVPANTVLSARAWDRYLDRRGIELPSRIAGLSDVASIAVGDHHAFAVKRDGSVWAWGSNDNDRLGFAGGDACRETADGGRACDQLTPTPVPGLADIAAVATSTTHSLALTKQGTVTAWGDNLADALGETAPVACLSGDADPARCHRPPAAVVGPTNVMAIAAGNQLSVVLNTYGEVWVWGEIGAGGDDCEASSPNKQLPSPTYSRAPIHIPELNGTTSIAARDGRLMAIKDDGSAWYWLSSTGCPPRQIPGFERVAAVDAGDDLYVLDADGGIWEVDWSGSGPKRDETIAGAVSLTRGTDFTYVIDDEGRLWAWGHNTDAQLGIRRATTCIEPAYESYDTVPCLRQPARVPNLDSVTAVAIGTNFTVALGRDGTVWSWGKSDAGQLGPRE